MNFIKMPIKIVERNGDVISFDDLNEASRIWSLLTFILGNIEHLIHQERS